MTDPMIPSKTKQTRTPTVSRASAFLSMRVLLSYSSLPPDEDFYKNDYPDDEVSDDEESGSWCGERWQGHQQNC